MRAWPGVRTRSGVAAVLFDRDGTLVADVPYNADPDAVAPLPGARGAVERVRRAGLRVGVVTNQSGVASGLLTADAVDRVNARVAELFGAFDTWQVCPHAAQDRCGCRKPAPGLVLAAARALDVAPESCVVIGDIGADVVAAQAAGALGILVPTPSTRPAEVAAAPIVTVDLSAAVDLVLDGRLLDGRVLDGRPANGRSPGARAVTGPVRAAPAPAGRRVLVARCDSDGDVLLSGPAIRAVAARAAHVTLLCGPRGAGAAELLPGVDEIVRWRVPWIDPDPEPVDRGEVAWLLGTVRALRVDEAIVLTSFHQSPLPLALLLRMAGVARVSAISDDYPGSLLDVRHRPPAELPEAVRALSLVEAAGYPRAPGDDGRLAIRGELPDATTFVGDGPYVVVHPGASVPARACPPTRCARIAAALAGAGRRVVVTGAPQERALTGYVAGTVGVDLGGRTSLRELAAVLAGAECVVVGNTGPAHLAAAVGTPVVSLFAPTVDFERWRPFGVPVVRLGVRDASCRDTRAAICPVPGHPCLSTVDPEVVVAAVASLGGRG